MSPTVTIIIPMYNVEAYIAECLQSLKDQHYRDFEAFCIDDGSSDATLEVAKEVIGSDNRFILIHQENRGQSAARNVALDRARGSFVLNLDSDDYYKPETLQMLVEKAEAENLDLLYFTAQTFYESRDIQKSNPELQDNREDIPGIMTGQQMYVEMERSGSFRPSACLFMARRSLIENAQLRFLEGIIHEDLLYTVLAAPYARRCAFLNKVLYLRRMRPGSTMTTKRGTKNIHGLLRVSMEMEQWLRDNSASVTPEFCDAFCHRIHHTRSLVMDDVNAIGEAEAQVFKDTLPIDERMAFDLNVLEPIASRNEILGSTTFKVGRALMAVPTTLKDRARARKG